MARDGKDFFFFFKNLTTSVMLFSELRVLKDERAYSYRAHMYTYGVLHRQLSTSLRYAPSKRSSLAQVPPLLLCTCRLQS